MSVIGDAVRAATAAERPLIVVERGQEWTAVRYDTDGRADWNMQLFAVLKDPCTVFLEGSQVGGLVGIRAELTERDRQFRAAKNRGAQELNALARGAKHLKV